MWIEVPWAMAPPRGDSCIRIDVHTLDAPLATRLMDGAELRPQLIAEVIDLVAQGWDGVIDDAGQPLPLTADNIAMVCRDPQFCEAFSARYVIALLQAETEKQGHRS